MVVLSAAICTRAGKTLVARQFMEMSRSRVEGLYAAFPKLIGIGQEHTFVETENVRYVYQPLEGLYVVLITTKSSNILEDIETLRMFARVIPEYCPTINEPEVLDRAYDLIFAFDEVVSLGYREDVSIPKIRTFVEMYSSQEKLEEQLRKSKEREAKEFQKQKIKIMDGYKKMGMSPRGGYSGASPMEQSFNQAPSRPQATTEYSAPEPYTSTRTATAPQKKGMKLGSGAPKKSDYLKTIEVEGLEESVEQMSIESQAQATGAAGKGSNAPLAYPDKVTVIVEEKIEATIGRDGFVKKVEIKGDLSIQVQDAEMARAIIRLDPVDDSLFQFKTHPNVDKKLFTADNVICLKDQNRPFPLHVSVGLMKWRFSGTDEIEAPLLVNCWPSVTNDGAMEVVVDYELVAESLELTNVGIALFLPSGSDIVVSNVDGDYSIQQDSPQSRLIWHIPDISASKSSGSFEFSVNSDNVDALFPIAVRFACEGKGCTVSKLSVAEVCNVAQDKAPMEFGLVERLETEPNKYILE